MASTLPETPSSLKNLCFQYLIDHLEDIPVESLALLPTAIRRTLAVHLPVADILQLEQTRFASGLDMPGVWKEVCEIRHFLSQYPKLVEMFESEIEAKEFVMMVIAFDALHHQKSSFDGGFLKLLSTKYHIRLERLYVDCKECVGTVDVVDVILPQLKQLSISCMDIQNSQSSYLKLVHSLISGCSQCLHTLTLDDCPDNEIENIISTVVSVFTNSPENFQSLRHFCVSVDNAARHRCRRTRHSLNFALRGIEYGLMSALITLCKAIQTHTSLHSCSFRQWCFWQRRGIFKSEPNVLGCILPLFEQPQFQCLTLTDTSFSLEDLQHLVHTFLTTPCNGPQMLKVERVQIVSYICIHVITSAVDHTAPSIIHDDSFLFHKSLVLHFLIPSSDKSGMQSAVKKWLSSISKLQPHSLTVTTSQ